jgi:hypothetical protein
MHPAFKVLLAGAVIAILVVVFRSQSQSAEHAGWKTYGTAEEKGFTVEALEAARDEAKDSSAEPWIAYKLVLKLYEAGGRSNLSRAQGVARETMDRFPGHPTLPWLQRLLHAAESFATVPDKA